MKPIIRVLEYDFQEYISANLIQAKVQELGAQIAKDYGPDSKPLMIAVLNGAFVFAADLVRATPLDIEITFVKLSSYTGTQSSGQIRSVIGLDQGKVKGREVIIVEDIVDTGRTLHHFVNDLRQSEPKSVKIASLLLKPEALETALEVDYLGFSIPPAFVIGYGLDYNEAGRNLPAIYQKV